MKYYIFAHGTMKLSKNIDLANVISTAMIGGFQEVSMTKFYKMRAEENSKKAIGKVKAAYETTKKKACNVKDALKN
jgi:hypothetical protein